MTDAIDLANGNDSHPISADTLEGWQVDEYEGWRHRFVYVFGGLDCFERAQATFAKCSRDQQRVTCILSSAESSLLPYVIRGCVIRRQIDEAFNHLATALDSVADKCPDYRVAFRLL